ncbi:MAG: hypothetical protein FJY37_13865 [Betaproteobacteria bacterium]|nr:hypothetical protein [Betaproteobacteria bacterium]
MKAVRFNRFPIGVFSMAVATALSGSAAFAADPVCAVSRDVSSVQGRGTGSTPQVQCLVEAKVVAIATSQDVSSIQGRGHVVVDRLASSATIVVSRELRDAPVQYVMGRSNQSVGAQFHQQGDVIAEKKPN